MPDRIPTDVFEMDLPLGSMTLVAVAVDGADLRLTLTAGAESFVVRTAPADATNADVIEAIRSVCGQRVDLTEDGGEAVLVTLEQRDGEWIWDEVFGLE